MIAYAKQYAKDRPEKIVEYNRKHYQLNKESITKSQKEWREKNIERLSEYSREYNKTHRVRLKEKYEMEKIEKIIVEPEPIIIIESEEDFVIKNL